MNKTTATTVIGDFPLTEVMKEKYGNHFLDLEFLIQKWKEENGITEQPKRFGIFVGVNREGIRTVPETIFGVPTFLHTSWKKDPNKVAIVATIASKED